MFEHLGAPAMYLANQLVLSLYASGLTVGMCLSSGFSVTQAAAIYEGHLLAHTVQELDIGGQSLTNNLQKLLRDNKGQNFNSSSGWQIVNHMKETMAYIAQGNIIGIMNLCHPTLMNTIHVTCNRQQYCVLVSFMYSGKCF